MFIVYANYFVKKQIQEILRKYMSKPRLEVSSLLIQIIFRKIIFKGEIGFVGDKSDNFSILAIRRKFILLC